MLDLNIVEFCDFFNNININTSYDDPDFIYHYTSSGGAKGVLENKTLRFTDRCFLNDESEGQYVLSLCKENIDSIISEESTFKRNILIHLDKKKDMVFNDHFRVYQCSFSGNSDSLCMWNYYTKSNGVKGYSLRFNASGLQDKVKPQYITADSKPKLVLGKVVYDQDEQIKIVKELIDKFVNYEKNNSRYSDFIASYAVKKILQQGAFFKKECFKIEEEYRLVIVLSLNDEEKFAGINNDLNYMERNDIFIPYVDIEFLPEVLTGITISPTLDSQATRLSLKLISHKNFDHITYENIKASEIPVRY